MKFTKLFMAAFAAMALASSCSKEAETLSPDISVAPGDAQISFELGKTTTYATAGDETLIHNMQVYAYFTNAAGTSTSADLTGSWDNGTKKLKHTFADGTYMPGSDATLFFLANTAFTFGQMSSLESVRNLVIGRTIYTINAAGDLELFDGKGMISFLEKKVTLVAGPIATETLSMKRVVARLYAEATGEDISGYKVSYANAATSGLISGQANTGTALINPIIAPEYTITGRKAGQFGDTEAVGYLYPKATGSPVTVTVTSPDGVTKPIDFTPMAHKNYKLKIKAAVAPGQNSSTDFELEIGDWDPATDEDLNADFSPVAPAFSVGTLVIPAGLGEVTAAGNVLTLDPFITAAGTALNINLEGLTYSAGSTAGAITSITSITVASPTTRADINYLEVKVGADNKSITVRQLANRSGVDAPQVKVTVNAFGVKGEAITGDLILALPSISADHLTAMAEATVEMANDKFVMFSTTGSLKGDYKKALAIKQAGGFTEAILSSKSFYETHIKGAAAGYGTNSPCPLGYKVPSVDVYTALISDNFTFGLADSVGNWVPKRGNEITLPNNNRVLKYVYDEDFHYCLFSLKEGDKTLWLTGNTGLMTASNNDGRFGAPNVANAEQIYSLSLWYGKGMKFEVKQKSTTLINNVQLRCVVDASYVASFQ